MSTNTYVIGNWKLNPETQQQASALIQAIHHQHSAQGRCTLGVTPSYVHLGLVAQQRFDGLWVGAQDLADKTAQTGAYTGDVSAAQLVDMGADFVILGHSERRAYHHETNVQLAAKLQHALSAGLKAVFCVGETQAQYDAKQTLAVLDEQLSILSDLSTENLLIAYEPVWAIGTGLTPTLTEVEQVHQHIQQVLAKFGLVAPVLYGGSVNAQNADEFAASAWVDGALVGGASLKADSFLAIAKAFS